MHIAYAQKGSGTYATVLESHRVDGKVVKTVKHYLGRVVDKERGIYENRERGLFTYDVVTDTFGRADLAVVPKRNRGRKLYAADFGDVYVVDRYMRDMGIMECIDGCDCPNKDTMKALVVYYMLSEEPNCCAQDWYEGSYASILYPGADLDGRRISEFLNVMGDEGRKRSFFDLYLPMITKGEVVSYIIDSTGVPNSIHMEITAISNHNGQLSLEVRLIFVCRKSDRMPLYFRDIPGNVIDSSMLIRTVDEVEQMGLVVDHVLMDAGYCTLENMKDLVDSHIQFITRLKPNFDMYKDMVKDHLDKMGEDKRILYKDRFVRVFSEEMTLEGYTRKLWVHLILDEDMKNAKDKTTFRKFQEGEITAQERDERYATNGLFILVSSFWIHKEDVLSEYFERNGVERLIDTAKTDCRLGEAAVHSDETLRGKWLIEFIALAVTKSMQKSVSDRKAEMMARKRKNKDSIPGRNMSVSNALFVLRNQKCDIFEEVILPREKTAKVNVAYGLFGYSAPSRIER